MKPLNQKRLATLAIALLSGARGKRLIPPTDRIMKFNMNSYAVNATGRELNPWETPECGSSCCFLGYAPIILPETSLMVNWNKVSLHVIGKSWSQFLFGGGWPSIPRQAAARALFMLLNPTLDHDLIISMRYKRLKAITALTDRQIINRLKKFL